MTLKPVRTAVIGCGMISDIYLQNCKNTFSILDLCGCADMVDWKAAAQAEKSEKAEARTVSFLLRLPLPRILTPYWHLDRIPLSSRS